MKLVLTGNLNASSLSAYINKFVQNAGGVLPKTVEIDFSGLSFVTPAGVTFLSNFVCWLKRKQCRVKTSGCEPYHAPVRYLDDSGFFEQNCEGKLWSGATPRGTTLPLQSIDSEQSHQWIRDHLGPWMAGTIGKNESAVYPVTASLSEIFNNIGDHSEEKIGSIFAQHFPNRNKLSICVADFGRGIPVAVRSKNNEPNDALCIIKAVERGFTTGGKNNAGEGLDYLLKTTVEARKANVEIRSLHGHVLFYNVRGAVTPHVLSQNGFLPGTTIDITLRTDLILDEETDSEATPW